MFTKEEQDALSAFLKTQHGKSIWRKWASLSTMYDVADHNDPNRALVEKGKKDFFISAVCDNVNPDTLKQLEA
jgi:hypothetical protein